MRLPAALAALALTAALAATPATAAVYNVSFSVGAGTAGGTITTDGTIGTLAAGNITDYSVLVADLANSFNLTPANSILVVIGTGLTASLTSLAFDHAAGNAAFGIVQASNGICLDAAGTTPGCNNTAPSANVRVNAVIYGTSASGQTEFATAATATAIPAPASAAVLLVGLAGLAATRRQRT